MKKRTNYITWIKNRWFKVFLLGHIKDLMYCLLFNKILIALLGLIIAIPHLILEGLLRLFVYLFMEEVEEE